MKRDNQVTRTPSTPGARQAKAEIPTDEQRVKAVYPDVRERHWGGPHHLEDGWKIEILDVEGKYTVCIGAARDRDAAFADAASKLPASLPAEGPDEHQCTWTRMTCDACPEWEGYEHVDRKVWPNAPLPAEGVALPPEAARWERKVDGVGAFMALTANGEFVRWCDYDDLRKVADVALSEAAALRKQLEEAIRERDGWKHDADWTRRENRFHSDWAQHGFWRWQGDGNDHLESLTCGVAISAADLQAIITRAETAERS